MTMEKENISSIDFDKIQNLQEVDYMDGDVAFHMDLRDLPVENGTLRMNLYAVVACIEGKLQLEIDTVTYTLTSKSVLLCRPNVLITNCMMSPDFKGAVLCVSQRVISENITQSDLWERAFLLSENPIIHLDDEEKMQTLALYGELLWLKKQSSQKIYRKEIVGAIIKAMMYELLANVETCTPLPVQMAAKQSDALFRRFITLLSGLEVKSRTVSWYADKLCITPKHLSAVCKQVSGKTAMEWIYEYVLVDIRNYLKNSDKSIKEIADKLNFPNISFFGKYCRKHLGVSPTTYRRRLRQDLPKPL